MQIINGAVGEGGGQILRTALSLSMITQTPFQIHHIRANRKKSGLMRQHLVCVKAAKTICQAEVTGDEFGSATLSFYPNAIQHGDFHFDIGSAGSTSLVLQTIMPALWFAKAPSSVTLIGGTHNPLAPTADFLQYGFLPNLQKLGINVGYQLQTAGFAPIGGGKILVDIQPLPLDQPSATFSLTTKTALSAISVIAAELNLNTDILKRELTSCQKRLAQDPSIPQDLIQSQIKTLKGIGEGNSCFAVITSQTNLGEWHEVVSLLGEKRTSAENIGHRLAGLIQRYVHQPACVDEYMTDQLLLPLALMGGGTFTSRFISEHTRTQAMTIEQFLPIKINIIPQDHHFVIQIQKTA